MAAAWSRCSRRAKSCRSPDIGDQRPQKRTTSRRRDGISCRRTDRYDRTGRASCRKESRSNDGCRICGRHRRGHGPMAVCPRQATNDAMGRRDKKTTRLRLIGIGQKKRPGFWQTGSRLSMYWCMTTRSGCLEPEDESIIPTRVPVNDSWKAGNRKVCVMWRHRNRETLIVTVIFYYIVCLPLARFRVRHRLFW